MLYIVVPTYNRIEVFYKFIDQLKAQTCQDYILVVVDHGKKKTKYSGKQSYVIESNVNGWSYAINVGIRFVLNDLRALDEDYVLVINDDVLMEENYLSCVYDSIKQRPKSLIGSGCYEWNSGEVLHLNMKHDYGKAGLVYNHQKCTRDLIEKNFYDSDVLKGRGTIIPVFVLKDIGIYNEIKLPHYRADHELAWRAKRKGYDVCVSGTMWLGAILDSPHRIEKNKSFFENYKRIFKDMISVQNTKDLWNYSFCCFRGFYAFYFFMMNHVRNHIFFVLNYWKEKKKHE